MARLPELKEVAKKFDLKIISIEDLVAYRMQNDSLISKKNDFQIETRFGSYRLRAYQQTTNDAIHIALTKGDWNTGETIPTRINSTLVNNDVLGTLTNDADKKLDEMFRVINKKGKGAIVFINQNSSPEKTLKRLNVLKDIQQDGTVVKAPSINMDEKDFTFDEAIKFLKYPKKINDEIEIHIGPYGYYMKHNSKNYKINQSGKYDEEYCLSIIRR